MSEVVDLEMLRGMSFFAGICDEHLQRLADISRCVQYPARKEIFRESDQASKVYVIKQGRVSLVICKPKEGCRQLMEVSDGDLIGWSPMVGRRRLSDTAYTITPTTALCVDAEQLLQLCREVPEFGFEFMHRTSMVLAERLSATRRQLMELSGPHLPGFQIESD